MGVLEENKPLSVFDATRQGTESDFLNVVVFPSKDYVNKNGLTDWYNGMCKPFGADVTEVEHEKIETLNSYDWYTAVIKLKGGINIYSYTTNKNGYCYSITFANQSTGQKTFENEVYAIVNSFAFETPGTLQTVKEDFENPVKDKAYNFVMPSNFYLTKQVNSKTLCPYAYGLYSDLLNAGNTDVVLVANNYFAQVFCLNIKMNMPAFDTTTFNLIGKMVDNQFRSDATSFEDVYTGPWDKAPDKVLLQKVRLTKKTQDATIYIFYCKTKTGTSNVIKVQLARALEETFEPDIYQLLLKNIE